MTPTPPTYPARPVNGGPLPQLLKYPRPGRWIGEPKVNGWRTLVHAETGTRFNRQGERLSIAGEFKEALTKLWRLNLANWYDCEAFERRHPMGRGCLVVLDIPMADVDYEHRRLMMLGLPLLPLIPTNAIEDTICRLPGIDMPDVRDSWDTLQQANKVLGCEFYEGLVLKKATSNYPMQLRSPDVECPDWLKSRWAF